MVLEKATQEVAECEPILVVCVDGESVVDHLSWCVLDDGVGEGVVRSSQVCEYVGPSVGSHEVLPVDRCRDVALDRVLPLLIRGRTFVAVLVVFVKLVGFGGTECCVVVAA